jgi:SAM-dependent methyltransferase
MQQMTEWRIESLPFIWGSLAAPHNHGGLPDSLPFTLTYNPHSGLLVQKPDAQVARALEQAYATGSELGSNADEDGIGRHYADDFLEFIARRTRESGIACRSVLEIGCGNGYLLSRLRAQFETARGIEPGPQGQDGARRFGLDIVQGFFPAPEIRGRYSAIVLASVLEHVEDPVALVQSLADWLEPGGRVFVSVPNEAAYIHSADVSTLFHEHWSYFAEPTLRTSMALAGFGIASCEESGFGGSLYAELDPSGHAETVREAEVAGAIVAARQYIALGRRNCERLREACERLLADGTRTLGVYVPARFVNAMAIAGLPAVGLRFFDDDPKLVGTYYPGIPVPVEAGASLPAAPVDTVLVMSRTFGPGLAQRLRLSLPRTEVLTVADLLD